MMYVAGETARLRALGGTTVAIVGSRRATDYGMEMARSLARGLAASGVTVAASLSDGIALAVHAGALEVDGKTLTAMESGLDVPCPARRRALYLRVRKEGCVVAELTIVVEADEGPIGLLGARIAKRDAGEVMLALSELEVMGLLTRADGGRYVQRESLAGR
jgi:predicted Rossmann fold nucleotide-binding protein DprA/Smf involved in DNA uptake